MGSGIKPLALGLALALALALALGLTNVTHDNTSGVRPLGIVPLFLEGSLGFFRLLFGLLFGQSPAIESYHSGTSELLLYRLLLREIVVENAIPFSRIKETEVPVTHL